MPNLHDLRNAEALAAKRFSVRHRVLDSRFGNMYMKRRVGYQGLMVDDQADVVVDGFPRSANTYAFHAIRMTLEPDRQVRGHTHAAATIREGVKRGLPTMVIVRDPDDAVASLVQLAQGASVARGFQAYTQFYGACLESLHGALLVDFTEITTSMPDVMHKLYNRFHLDWPLYQGTPEDEQAVMNAIDGFSKRRRGGVIHEAGVARPSAHRLTADKVLINLTKHEREARMEARKLYQELAKLREIQL